MLRLDAKLGEMFGFSPLGFVRGHFQEIGIAALSMAHRKRCYAIDYGAKVTSCGKVA